MGWWSEQFEKLKEVSSLAVTITIDSIYVVFATILSKALHHFVESNAIVGSLDDPKNSTVRYILFWSETLVISLSVIYTVGDIIRHLIKIYKSIKDEEAS